MTIDGKELGGFEIKKKFILSADCVNINNMPKLVLTIERVKALDEKGNYIKFMPLKEVKNYILNYPIKIIKKFQIFIDKPEKNNKKGFSKLFEMEKFQILAKKRRDRGKKWFIGYGKQKAGAPYTIKPNYKSGISAPPAGE